MFAVPAVTQSHSFNIIHDRLETSLYQLRIDIATHSQYLKNNATVGTVIAATAKAASIFLSVFMTSPF